MILYYNVTSPFGFRVLRVVDYDNTVNTFMPAMRHECLSILLISSKLKQIVETFYGKNDNKYTIQNSPTNNFIFHVLILSYFQKFHSS